MSKDLTSKYRTLNDHIVYNKRAGKTVCVTTCLNYFGIPFDSYHYTHSKSDVNAFKTVLRKQWSVRSRKSEFKVKYPLPTMTALRKALKKSNYTEDDKFIVSGVQTRSAHLMVLDGNGETIIDTAKGMKWKIRDVSIVEAK